MSPALTCRQSSTCSFPRVSGDEPTDVGTELSIDVFSPRERG